MHLIDSVFNATHSGISPLTCCDLCGATLDDLKKIMCGSSYLDCRSWPKLWSNQQDDGKFGDAVQAFLQEEAGRLKHIQKMTRKHRGLDWSSGQLGFRKMFCEWWVVQLSSCPCLCEENETNLSCLKHRFGNGYVAFTFWQSGPSAPKEHVSHCFIIFHIFHYMSIQACCKVTT